MSSINDSYKEINKKFKAVCQLNDLVQKEDKLEEDDKSFEFLVSFFSDAKLTMSQVEDKIKSIEDRYKEVVTFYGDTPKDLPMETFIEILNKFSKDLNVKIF